MLFLLLIREIACEDQSKKHAANIMLKI